MEDSKCNNPTVTPPSTRKEDSKVCIVEEDLPPSKHVSPTIGQDSSADDPIVLDDDADDEDPTMVPQKLWNANQATKRKSNKQKPMVLGEIPKPPRKRKAVEVVVLDDERAGASQTDKRKPSCSSSLTFSVSKNSGRITIHYSTLSNESSLTNFEIDQVVSTTTADKLMEAKTHRTSASASKSIGGIPIEFNSQAIQQGK